MTPRGLLAVFCTSTSIESPGVDFGRIIRMTHSVAVDPRKHAVYSKEKFGKSTIFRSKRVLVGLNAFEPGQEHPLHAHSGMDKVYHVIEGQGLFLLDDKEIPMHTGLLLVAPDGVPHGIRNNTDKRLVVLAVLAPGPQATQTEDRVFLDRPPR